MQLDYSPGPGNYETRIDSCNLAEHRRVSFTRTKRFFNMTRPAATPDAALYDTSCAVTVLLKRMGSVKIPEAKRDTSPQFFSSKNASAIIKGIYLSNKEF